MSIFIPRKKEFWLRKPTDRMEVNWGNQLTEGLDFILIADTHIESIISSTADITASAFEFPLGTSRIVAPSLGGNSTASFLVGTTFNDFNATTFSAAFNNSGAVLGSCREVDNSKSLSFIASSENYASGTADVRAWIGLDTTEVANGKSNDTPLVISKPYIMSATIDNLADISILVDGGGNTVQYGSAGTYDNTWHTGQFLVGDHGEWPSSSGDSADQDIEFFFRWRRLQSIDEQLTLSEAPYQILKPRKTYFLLNTAGASGPTLALHGFPA